MKAMSRPKEVLEIKKYPDPVLRKKSKPVKVVELAEQKLFNDMVATMHKMRGVGLAAPQIGIVRRLIVVDIGAGIIKLANPEIVECSGREPMEEGCLSVPGTTVEITRASKIVVKGLNVKSKPVSLNAEGLLARVIQHEIDHLDGKLILDHAAASASKSSTRLIGQQL